MPTSPVRSSTGSPTSATRSNGEDIVVRAAMKPLPTLMRPLSSADLDTGEAATALVERSDVAAVEALAVVAEACVAFELARALAGPEAVLALGGGAVLSPVNRERLEARAFGVFLDVDVETGWKRVRG